MNEIWISRDWAGYGNEGSIYLWNRKPIINPKNNKVYSAFHPSDLLTRLCYELFSKCTGFKLNPGECKKVIIHIEEKNDE